VRRPRDAPEIAGHGTAPVPLHGGREIPAARCIGRLRGALRGSSVDAGYIDYRGRPGWSGGCIQPLCNAELRSPQSGVGGARVNPTHPSEPARGIAWSSSLVRQSHA
jgi:hypothetical protein